MMMCDVCGKKAHRNDRDADIETVTIEFREGVLDDNEGSSIADDTFECCADCRKKIGLKVEAFIASLLIDEAK